MKAYIRKNGVEKSISFNGCFGCLLELIGLGGVLYLIFHFNEIVKFIFN